MILTRLQVAQVPKLTLFVPAHMTDVIFPLLGLEMVKEGLIELPIYSNLMIKPLKWCIGHGALVSCAVNKQFSIKHLYTGQCFIYRGLPWDSP